jgi:osmotically inducible lipoprotein OsmB
MNFSAVGTLAKAQAKEMLKEIIMSRHTVFFALAIIAAPLLLSACGTSKTDRAASGGAIGAGVGAVGSSVVGGSLLGGAIVGGAVGAATGALTDKDDINLD